MPGSPYRYSHGRGDVCPLDGSPMAIDTHPSGETVRRCKACHGVWLAEDGLTKILRWAEHAREDDIPGSEPLTAVATAMARQKHRTAVRCPICEGDLIAEERGSYSYVLVDVCPEGCGTWLDDMELRRLIDFVRTRFG